jgi:hypothetical protein
MFNLIWEDRSWSNHQAMGMVRVWNETVGGQVLAMKSSDLARVHRDQDGAWLWNAWVPRLVFGAQPGTLEQAQADAVAWVEAHGGGEVQKEKRLVI